MALLIGCHFFFQSILMTDGARPLRKELANINHGTAGISAIVFFTVNIFG